MLQAAGISEQADSVDFISLDGYERTHTIEELKKLWPQGRAVMGLGKETLGPCGWVNYNARGLGASKGLPPANILFAFEENGKKLENARLDPETGRVAGTGPLRLIVPQSQISPPDMGQYAETPCQSKVAEPYRFHEGYDHNGGKSSFAIIAVRVSPLPKGTRDFEWEKLREQFAAGEKIVFFGALKSRSTK